MVRFHASTGDPSGHHAHDHGAAAAAASQASTAFLALLGGWMVMVLAMMLPTAVPLLDVLAGLVRRDPWR